jgi:tRNA nucleotidyltransferase/poly(A) polymerase
VIIHPFFFGSVENNYYLCIELKIEVMFKFYEVGGKVRDELLGLKSKDVDFVAVPHDMLLRDYTEASDMFTVLDDYLTAEKFEIFLRTPDCYTIRAMFPKDHKYQGVADFVMARKEIGYVQGTRTPIVKPGTLYDDLERRDFTVNAMARNDDGSVVDYFNGMEDLRNKVLRTPLDVKVTFDDDPLRILRAIRFAITKGFTIPNDMWHEIYHYDYDTKMSVVSEQRIREELYKCFRHDTLETLERLRQFSHLTDYIFTKTELWLKPTFEQ